VRANKPARRSSQANWAECGRGTRPATQVGPRGSELCACTRKAHFLARFVRFLRFLLHTSSRLARDQRRTEARKYYTNANRWIIMIIVIMMIMITVGQRRCGFHSGLLWAAWSERQRARQEAATRTRAISWPRESPSLTVPLRLSLSLAALSVGRGGLSRQLPAHSSSPAPLDVTPKRQSQLNADHTRPA